MTREEAILCLKGVKNYARDTFTEQTDWQTSLDIAIEALEQEPWEDWYDVPSNEMTLEQARQAVKDLRKKLAEYLEEQESCEDCVSREQAQTEIEMNACRYTLAQESGCMGNVEWSDSLIKVSDAVDIIRNLPSIISKGVTVTDFADKCRECGKQKKSKWITKFHGFPPEPSTVCLKCGFDRDFYIRSIGFDKIKFCPNCGRKMEGEKNDTDK